MNLIWALFMDGSQFKHVYPLYHRITYTWHEPKRSSIAFAREKHFFFKMFLTIYHSRSRISVLLLGTSSMALNFVVLCLCVCLYKIPYDQILFKKVPHSARLTSRRNVLSIHGLVNEQMGIWNGLHSKNGMILKIEVHPYPITKRVLSRRSFDSWAIKRWWTSWRPHWVVSHHLLREKSWSHHFLNCHVLHKLQMTIK